jgi:diguanylate cyclase (GGDEF)-like protein
MFEAEEKPEAAVRERNTRDRAQRERIAWIGMTAASYATDTLFLALFAVAGTLSGTVAVTYGAAAAAISAGTYWATASGWNLKLRDPSLVKPLNILGIAMQLGVVLVAPQIAFPFLANLFTVFAFGMIWLPLRASIALWALGIAGTAAVFYVVRGRIGVPDSSAFELILVWLYFSLILARCLLLSVAANAMRARLADSRRKLAASLEQVQQLASHDELTGTINRRSLMAAMERERMRAERSGAVFSLAMIDLDHFKRVNDTYGHAAGDEVLRAFAATVRATMRATDVFGRYGGEEFVLILVGDAPASALKAMERIRVAVAAKDWSAIAPDLPVTLSAGIASHCKGETIEQMLHRADLALYLAKDAGRNSIIANPDG